MFCHLSFSPAPFPVACFPDNPHIPSQFVDVTPAFPAVKPRIVSR
jgi:hypothetical protein